MVPRCGFHSTGLGKTPSFSYRAMTDLETPNSLTIWATVQVLARVAREDLEEEIVIDGFPGVAVSFGFVPVLKLPHLRLPVAHVEGVPGVVDGGWLEPESHA